jgi:hypothetical protein
MIFMKPNLTPMVQGNRILYALTLPSGGIDSFYFHIYDN